MNQPRERRQEFPLSSIDLRSPDTSAPSRPSTFAELGVPGRLVAALEARGIAVPFPIQAATVPDALAGRDVCGRAPTGSGKTIAFGLPLVLGVGRAQPKRPLGLVLVPTRELASQVCAELRQLAAPSGRSVEAIYGGVAFGRQLTALRRGVDIVVACPGRLADLVSQGAVDLADVRVAVIDEADRLADMGFLPEVRRLLDRCTSRTQTLLFSATLDGAVDVLIRGYQRDPVRHDCVGSSDETHPATHLFWSVDREKRLQTTAAVVRRAGPTVVFCRTKRGADRVARQLDAAGVAAVAIHGDRSQAQRERALDSFHRGQATALVATDVAARGIHVDDVACVVHFDPPGDPKDYVHRSGRTARAGAAGVVVSVVPDDLRGQVRDLQAAVGLPDGLTPIDLSCFDPDAVNQPTPMAPQRPVGAKTKRARGQRRTEQAPTDRRTGGGGRAGGGSSANRPRSAPADRAGSGSGTGSGSGSGSGSGPSTAAGAGAGAGSARGRATSAKRRGAGGPGSGPRRSSQSPSPSPGGRRRRSR